MTLGAAEFFLFATCLISRASSWKQSLALIRWACHVNVTKID
jgi:hypothetical protein